MSVKDEYSSGLLNDFGGGNVQWWHDYITTEVGRCNEFHHDIEEQLESQLAATREELEQVTAALFGANAEIGEAQKRIEELEKMLNDILEAEDMGRIRFQKPFCSSERIRTALGKEQS